MSQQLQELLAGTSPHAIQQLGPWPFVLLMIVSLACSFVVSLLYVQFYASRATGSQVHRAFPLLGVSVTAIFVCIQFSLPLSLGLLGALSIVRFRTPIKEPEEVGFIMLVIALSIATATLKLAFVGLLLIAAIAALLLQMRRGASRRGEGTLVVSVPEDAGARESAITDAVCRHITGARLESLARQEQQLVLSYAFRDMKGPTLDELQADLPRLAPGLTFSLFFARPGVS